MPLCIFFFSERNKSSKSDPTHPCKKQTTTTKKQIPKAKRKTKRNQHDGSVVKSSPCQYQDPIWAPVHC